jgi:hypothetical protein
MEDVMLMPTDHMNERALEKYVSATIMVQG